MALPTAGLLLVGGGIVCSLVAFGVFVARVWSFTVDDAFITFRYSKMFAAGDGPIYDPGLKHAEGYTSFLWMLVMSIPHAFGVSPVVFAKGFGVALMLATMGLACFIVDRHSPLPRGPLRILVDAFPLLLLALFVPTAVHAVAGMETPLYTFLVTAYLATLALWRSLPERWGHWLLGAIALLVGLTRPEGNLVVVVGLIVLLLVEQKRRRQIAVSAVCLYVLPGLAYFLWRFWYYGHLFPLPYYIKLGDQSGLAGLADVKSFVRLLIWLLPLALVGLFGPNFKQLIAPAIAALSLLVFFVFPSHIQGYEWRFDYPVIPFGVALAALGIARISSPQGASWRRKRELRWLATAGLVLLIGLTLRNTTSETRAQLRLYAWDGNGANRVREELGRYLSRFEPRKSLHVFAMGDSGATPYYSGWRAIDTYGLNDNHVATSGYYAATSLDAGYVLSYNPELIVITNHGESTFSPEYDRDRALFREAYARGMRRVVAVKLTPHFSYWLIAKPDTPIARYLKAWRPPVPGPRPRPGGDNPVMGAIGPMALTDGKA